MMRITVILVALGLAVLVIGACGGGMTREKCEEEGGKLEREMEKVIDSDFSRDKIERELAKLEDEAWELREKCAPLFEDFED